MTSPWHTVLTEQLQKLAGCRVIYDDRIDELTLEVPAEKIKEVCLTLRDNESLKFEQMMDLCGIDYLEYGLGTWQGERFAVVYHLLSLTHNWRLRVRAFLPEKAPKIKSVVAVWNCANWFEREAFDLYGILFENHPDLRRLLTDYGFIGHPFRKDFPLSGHVEMRYDPQQKRVIYEPVSIEPRILEPRVIRDDYRYINGEEKNG